MTIFGRVLRTARTWRSSAPLRRTLSPNPPPRAISPDLPFPPRRLCHRSSEHQFHFNTSEIENQGPKSVRKLKAVFGVLGFAVAFLGMISGYADAAELEVFHESVKRGDLSIQSTDTALANALNGSYLDSNVTCKTLFE